MTVSVPVLEQYPITRKNSPRGYMMLTNGKPQFHWSLLSLSGIKADRYVFVVPKPDDATPFITDQCAEMGITEYKTVEYDFPVSSQAECVMIAAPYIGADQSLLIWNIDMTAEPGEITSGQFRGDGSTLSPAPAERHGSHPGSGAVLLQDYQLQVGGGAGSFYFRTATLFEKLFYDCYIPASENADKHIGSLYGHLIRQGGTVYLAEVPAMLTASGTPALSQPAGKVMRVLHLLRKGE